MLVLTRRIGESIIIDGNIEVKILSFSEFMSKDQIKIGIAAPKDIRIMRKEIIKSDKP